MSDNFFTDPLVEEISQGHIEKIEKLEDAQARKMLETFKSVRQDLSGRLFRGKEGTFTEQQMRGTLVQVERVIEILSKKLKEDLSEGVDVVGVKGVEDLVTEIKKFSKKFEGAAEPIDIDSALIATDTSNFLINQYESSVDSYSEGLRSQITQGLTEAVVAKANLSQVVFKLGQFFGGEQWKIERIARTELHNMYNKAKMEGMSQVQDQYLPDLKKTLFHPMDARTGEDSKLAAGLNLIVDIDKPFVYRYKGIVRKFMTPPDRPNDRSILIPYRAEWGKEA